MQDGKKKKMLTVVVPCYNEAAGLMLFYRRLLAQMESISAGQYEYEIIFVNDGSRDQTLSVILELAAENNHVKYISFSRNFGKEAAMLAGLEQAAGDAVVLMDADLQHPPELIPQMLDRLEEGYDQVIAKRDRKGDRKSLTLLANLFYKMMNRTSQIKLENGAGDFRMLRRETVDAVISLKEANRFSKGLFSWVGFHQTFLPYENQQRAADQSKWSLRQLVRYGVDGMLSFNVQPLRICVYLGGSLLLISMLYLFYLFVRILMFGVDVPGYFTTITIISVLGGVQLISLGIIGEYVGRIYAEVKRRPHYIVAKTNIRKKDREVQERSATVDDRQGMEDETAH